MKLLLDTNVFLRFALGDERLPTAYVRAIQDGGNEVFLSAAAAWEICVKVQIGKLTLPQSPEVYIPAMRNQHSIRSLSVTERAALRLRNLPMLHRDPFDRVMICQAIDGGLSIMTLDRTMHLYPASFFTP